MGADATPRLRRPPVRISRPALFAAVAPTALLLAAGCFPGRSRQTVTALGDLDEKFQEIGARAQGAFGVLFRDLARGETVALRENESFPLSGAGMLYVLLEVFRSMQAKELTPEDRLPWRNDFPDATGRDRFRLPGSPPSEAPTVRDIVERCAVDGDPAAADLLVERLGGLPKVAAAARRFGTGQVRLAALWGDPVAEAAGRDSTATPYDLAVALQRFWKGEILDHDAAKALRGLLIRHARRTLIPRKLPDAARVYHCAGIGTSARGRGIFSDAAVVETPQGAFVLVVMGNDLNDPEYTASLVGEIAEACYRHMLRR